ncbi:MAG: hypothetical protein RIS85_2771, partial [Pseudomonadota bacterium]
GSMAITLIGGTLGGTILTLGFLPALYSLWFGITPPSGKAPEDGDQQAPAGAPQPSLA